MDIYAKRYATNYEEMIQLQKQLQKITQLEKKLKQHFDFEIPKYVIVDIADNETYHHICTMINLATVNKRLSIQNAATLKEGIKELFNVKNKYDNVETRIILE